MNEVHTKTFKVCMKKFTSIVKIIKSTNSVFSNSEFSNSERGVKVRISEGLLLKYD